MRIASIAVTAALFVTATAAAGSLFEDDCRYTAPRRATTPSAGVTRVIIHAEAGSLLVTGVPGATQVAVDGTACSSDEDFLSGITLTMRKTGSDLHIEARVPSKIVVFGFHSARLDVSVTLPAGLPVEIDDSSGWIKVSNTGPTKIDDGSGSIDVRNISGPLVIRDDSGAIDVHGVAGNVTIDDGSGSISVVNVTGDVQIEDGSGAILVEDVRGSLRVVEDGSGSITARQIRGDVIVERDGSGAIDVGDVTGDFKVGRKGSGSISHDRVAGLVEVPRRR